MKLSSLNRLIVQSVPGSLIVSAALLATSTYVFAQTPPEPGTHQVTRAEVLHELEELEAVGYNPSQGDDADYPADIQAAEQKVAAKHLAEKNALMGAKPAEQTVHTP